jgi:Plasmid pRiA4b ORF-3-like protein
MRLSEIYQFHAWLRGISPLIWRRLLVRSDQTVANLHYALQLAFGWSDSHLNKFRIHGQDFSVYHIGGPIFDEGASKVHLADFHFRVGERFLYEYDFGNHWEHQIRLIAECARKEDIRALRDLAQEIPTIQTWLTLHKFDRRKVNHRLRQYAIGDAEWRWPQGGTE